jgi:hypothetical protein
MAHVRSHPPDEDHLWRDARLRRGLLAYCQNYQCSRSTAIGGDRWPDGIRLFDIEPPFTCQACGKKGAEMSGPCLRIRAIECATTQQLPVTVARHPFSAR